MTNVSLEPGTWESDDIIADTDDGIYMDTNRSWSIDDMRLNFQFGTEVGYEIKNGKRGRLLKNCTYAGITPDFWNSCDAIANAETLEAVGHAQLRQRRADADDGYGPWRIARAVSQGKGRSFAMNFPQIAEILMKASPAEADGSFRRRTGRKSDQVRQQLRPPECNGTQYLDTVRSVIGTRVGIAVSNDTRPESLHALARRAYEVAKLQPENPEFKGLPEPQAIRSVASFDPGVAECTPERRASIAGVICGKGAAAKYTAAGSVTTAVYNLGVANSRGVMAETSVYVDGRFNRHHGKQFLRMGAEFRVGSRMRLSRNHSRMKR